MTWHKFLLIGKSGRARTHVERGLFKMFSVTNIIVADGADAAVALLGRDIVDCIVMVTPSHDRRWGASVRSILRAKPDLQDIPFVLFDGSKGWQRSNGARVFYG